MEWTGNIVIVAIFIVSLLSINKLGFVVRVMLEGIALLNVFMSISTSPLYMSALHVCLVAKLTRPTVKELNDLLRQLGNLELDDDTILKKLMASYSHVALARERTDGSLQGYLYYGIERGELNGRKYTFIKIGPMMFHPKYRRNIVPVLVLLYLALYELTFHATRSVYFVAKSTTYKSYLSAVSKTQHCYPRYDRETPPFETKLLHKFAQSVCSPGESYDHRTFVLERELIKFKPSAAFITEEDMKNPHIRFFAERNRGWINGHSMLIIGHMTWWQVIRLACRSLNLVRSRGDGAVTRGSKRKVESRLRKVWDRHISFQSELARREVANQYWVTHGKLQHRKLSSLIQLDSVSEMDEYDNVDIYSNPSPFTLC